MTASAPLLFIGVGKIGGPIARRLVAAGLEVHIYDESGAALAAMDGSGASIVDRNVASPKNYERVILCLPEPAAVLATADRWALGAGSHAVIADLTTLSPSAARKLSARFAAAGIQYLDTPVSGGERGANTGELVVLSSGPRPAFERIEDVLRKIGRWVHFVGEVGVASQLKAVNQHVYLAYNFAVAQGWQLGRDLGLPEEAVLDLLTHGAPAHALINERLPLAMGSDFKLGFLLSRCLKDLDCLETPGDFSSDALRAFEYMHSQIRRAVDDGAGHYDILALHKGRLP
jgi:3-hydroxyisobutyrate dehydrogenase-like beta-hydroxyacid dehydrogenase